MEGEITPVIAPAALEGVGGREAHVAARDHRGGLLRSRPPSPRTRTAPHTALRWGAHISSHSTGGPACSTVRPSRPGIRSPAAPAPTIIGPGLPQARQGPAVALVDPLVPVGRREHRRRRRGRRPPGGRQSSASTSACCCRRASAIRSRPAVTIRNSLTGGSYGPLVAWGGERPARPPAARADACASIPACAASATWRPWRRSWAATATTRPCSPTATVTWSWRPRRSGRPSWPGSRGWPASPAS